MIARHDAFDAVAAEVRVGLTLPDTEQTPLLRHVATSEIEHVRAQGNYVELHVGGRSHLLRTTMAALEARLDPKTFMRVHRSRIVRIDMIAQIEAYAAGQYLLRLRSGTTLLSGRQYREALLAVCGVRP